MHACSEATGGMHSPYRDITSLTHTVLNAQVSCVHININAKQNVQGY